MGINTFVERGITMNELLFVGGLLLMLGLMVLSHHLFGKWGLITWVPVTLVLINILCLKQFSMLGFHISCGALISASTFTATDILTECYGKKVAIRAVWVGLGFGIVVGILSLIVVRIIPNDFNWIGDSLDKVMELNIRIFIASMIAYTVSNLLDVHIYSFIGYLTRGKAIWLRNNVATIICNSIDNMVFTTAAYAGSLTLLQCLTAGFDGSIVDIGTALADTPFVYLAVWLFKKYRAHYDAINA